MDLDTIRLYVIEDHENFLCIRTLVYASLDEEKCIKKLQQNERKILWFIKEVFIKAILSDLPRDLTASHIYYNRHDNRNFYFTVMDAMYSIPLDDPNDVSCIELS